MSPTMPAPSGQDEIALAILTLAESIKAGQHTGVNTELEKMIKVLADREEARPHENVFNPPMFSHYNPDGERDNPRPELACEMVWTGFKLSKECLTKEEILLLNRLHPGDFPIVKGDGARIQFKVTEKLGTQGKRERLTIFYPCKSTEDRSNHLSMANYMRQALGESQTNEDLLRQIDELKRQVAKG